MERYNCTCHCGGSMFYKHLHDPSCDLFTHGEEAPQSKEAQLQAALDAERANRLAMEACVDRDVKATKDLKAQLATLQAQLRQVEGERDEWERKCRGLCQAHGVLLIEHHDMKKDLTTLRQLVAQLQFYKDVSVSHRVEGNGLETWKVWVDHNPLAECDTEGEASAIKGLLTYRAILAAQDAPQPAPNERVEYARLELAALFSTPGAPTLEQAKLVCENKNPADAQCILNAYEALREAAQDAGVVIRRIVDDSFGSQMEMCSREDCGLQVVRPGQFQCLHPNCYDADQPHPTEERHEQR